MARVTFGPGFTSFIEKGDSREYLQYPRPAGPTGPNLVCPYPGCTSCYTDRNGFLGGHWKKKHGFETLLTEQEVKRRGVNLDSSNLSFT